MSATENLIPLSMVPMFFVIANVNEMSPNLNKVG